MKMKTARSRKVGEGILNLWGKKRFKGGIRERNMRRRDLKVVCCLSLTVSPHQLLGRLHYMYLDHVHHPSLRSMRVPVFFKLCRLEGVSFDLCTQVSSKITWFFIDLLEGINCTTESPRTSMR